MSVQAPQPIIIILNMANISQGIVMFVVFALKDTTIRRLKEKFSFGGNQSKAIRQGKNQHRGTSVSRNLSSASLTRQASCASDKSSDIETEHLPLRVSSDPNPRRDAFSDPNLIMVDLSD